MNKENLIQEFKDQSKLIKNKQSNITRKLLYFNDNILLNLLIDKDFNSTFALLRRKEIRFIYTI